MARVRHVLTSAAGAAVLAASLVPTAGAAPGTAATTCQGKPVTIVASMTVTTGTEGDDVVAMTPEGWTTFDALGGDDTVCLAAGADVNRGGRDPVPIPPTFDAGSGDDVVVNQAAARTEPIGVSLGSGQDTYTGGAAHDVVRADTGWATYGATEAPSGAQRDVVTTGSAGAEVTTLAPSGGLNDDRITLGAGTGRVFYGGEMGPGGLLDVTAATSAALELPFTGEVASLPAGELLLDTQARRATVAGTAVLAWQGDITSYVLGQHGVRTRALTVSFLGSDLDEGVTVQSLPLGEVRMGGGDDGIGHENWSDEASLFRAADGGEGHDSAYFDTTCSTLRLDLPAASASCDAMSGTVRGFEEVGGSTSSGGSDLVLVGTDAAERLVAIGDRVTVRAGGGADIVLVDDAWTSRVRGGAGPDRLYVSGDDVVVHGQAGRDRIVLIGSAGPLPAGAVLARRRQHAFGGPGADVLQGTSGERGDRLVGGAGRDRANGLRGKRDRCSAEETKNCELP